MTKASPRIARLPRFAKPKRAAIGRAEFDRLFDQLNERAGILEKLQRDLEIQFRRTAQLQMEVDELKRTLARLKS